jgi:hypothetical protein
VPRVRIMHSLKRGDKYEVFFPVVERAIVFSPAQKGDKQQSIFVSEAATKEAVTFSLTQRDGR